MQVSDTGLIKIWLVPERRAELSFESHRFSDLRGWLEAEVILGVMGKNFSARHYLYSAPWGLIYLAEQLTKIRSIK